MIEMPEALTLAKQMNQTLIGKTIKHFKRGNKTHKFLWLNFSDDSFSSILPDLTIREISSFGRSIYMHLGNYMIWWSDFGGKLLYHKPGSKLPKNSHLIWEFNDESALTFSMQMWGSVKLLNNSEFNSKPNDETGVEPLSNRFTFSNFNAMLDEYPEKNSKGIKGFLVATGYVTPNHIAGLGNAILQDILFNAKINPKRKIVDITRNERKNLFKAINETVAEIIKLGGRYDEVDLFGNNGKYIRLMDKNTNGTPCINCQTTIQKISYLGGACYICPSCQT
jgi:formamidopyrimidine-DNA glycosylase